jgi:hypothetical protein
VSPRGRPDKWLVNARRAIAGEHEARGPVPAMWWSGKPPNHQLAEAVGNYGLDPHGPWRAELLEILRSMATEWGLWCIRRNDEALSGSHCAHYYGATDGLLLIALNNSDEEMVAAVLAVIRGVHALETACATRDGRIVAPGAREPGVGGEKANQRMNRNVRWGWIEGRKVHLPKPEILRTADDELGLWCLVQIGHDLAASLIRGGKLEDVVLRNPLRVTRASDGRHLAVFERTDGMTSPSTWAFSYPEAYGLPGSLAPLVLTGNAVRIGVRS